MCEYTFPHICIFHHGEKYIHHARTRAVEIIVYLLRYNKVLMDIFEESLEFHKKLRGKLSINAKAPIKSRKDLSLMYTPGVAAASRAIAEDPAVAAEVTGRANTVAVITDGTSVLGLGDIGPLAGLPVMEGKCALFKEFAGIDAFPILIDSKDTDEIVRTIKNIALSFGAINLEDISAPRCFEIGERLKAELDIPVMHDDQHGTAIVIAAGLMNAFTVTNRTAAGTRVVINGAGAAGVATAKLLRLFGIADIALVDSKGIISPSRTDLAPYKKDLLGVTNPRGVSGSLADALIGADVVIGVSVAGAITEEMVRSMNKDAIVFALANPTPEIMPELAKAAGAAVVATGRSDFPNQVNNVLAYPGIFRGALDGRKPQITDAMKAAAACALACIVEQPTAERIIPDVFDPSVVEAVSRAVVTYGTPLYQAVCVQALPFVG